MRARASEIYRQRGKVLQRKVSESSAFMWKHMIKQGKTYYKINREHPLVEKVLDDAEDKATLRSLLSLIEQTVPAPLIVINNAEAPDSLGQPYEDSATDLRAAMHSVFDALVESGKDSATAARSLLGMEPFNQYPDLIAGFLEEVAAQAATGE